MNGDRSGRWAAVSGFLFVALSVAGTIAIGNQPDNSKKDAVQTLTAYFSKSSNQNRAGLAYVLLLLSLFFFLWFLAGLRTRLRGSEAEPGSLSTLAVAGGVMFASLAAGAAIFSTAVGTNLSYADAYKLDPNEAILFQSLGYALLVGALLGAGVLMFSTWALARRTRAVPVWLAWVGFVFGIATLGLFFTAFFTILAFALWVLLASVVMLMPGSAAMMGVEAATTGGPAPPGA